VTETLSSELPIYLDYNATSPLAPEVYQAMEPFLKQAFGNPSSSHPYGYVAREAVEKARRQVAAMLGCEPDEIIFTSGGTEANNLAIIGYSRANQHRGKHIITSAVEHPAVLEVCRLLEREGFEITILPVDGQGLVSPEDLETALRSDTILVSIMHANNEVGTIQPIENIARILNDRKVALHVDGAQAVGKISVDLSALGVSLYSLAAHKFYGPKGIGALYVRRGLKLQSVLQGASQERSLRPGTENVAAIVGLGKACELVRQHLKEFSEYYRTCRDALEQGLKQNFPGLVIHASQTQRLPNTSSIAFPGISSAALMAEMSELAISAGAACHSESVEISHVLKAMGVPPTLAEATMRISVGRNTTLEEIDKAVEIITHHVKALQATTHVIFREIESVKLTQYTTGLGCACKLSPQLLEKALQQLPGPPPNSRILVDHQANDDAAVYLLDEEHALIQTVDFFTPIVDDPYTFGAVSAANSLSDIYAMGGRPILALSIMGFPANRLPMQVLQAILAGAADKVQEAGIAIVGGHTVDDAEPKFGLAVTGLVHPQRLWRNQGAKAEDWLLLTKPLGTGVLATALKRKGLDKAVEKAFLNNLLELNQQAAQLLEGIEVHAVTDVTGFGLLGHLWEMIQDSNLAAEINATAIPLLPGARVAVQEGFIPGGTKNNWQYLQPHLELPQNLPHDIKMLLVDAQTSGGLLIALPPNAARRYLQRAQANELKVAAIGRFIPAAQPSLRVIAD